MGMHLHGWHCFSSQAGMKYMSWKIWNHFLAVLMYFLLDCCMASMASSRRKSTMAVSWVFIQANAKVRCGWSATMDQACHRHFAHRDAHGGRQNLHAFLLLQWGLLVGWKEIVLLLRCFIRMHGLVSLLNDLVQLKCRLIWMHSWECCYHK